MFFYIQNYKKIKRSLLKSSFLHRITWAFIGAALSKLLILVGGILAARILGKEEFGQFSIVRSTINMFVIFGSSGIGITATKYVAEYIDKNREKLHKTIHTLALASYFLGVLLVLLFFLTSNIIAEKILFSPHLTLPLQVGSLLLFFTITNSFANGTLIGFNKFKTLAYNNFWGSLIEAIGMLLGAQFYGVIGAVIGFGIGIMIIYILNYVSVKKTISSYEVTIKTTITRIPVDWKMFTAYTLPSTLSSALILPVFWIIKSLLVRKYGFSELSSFEVAEQWKNIILFVPISISQVILPQLIEAKNIRAENSNQTWNILKKNLKISLGITSLLGITATLFSDTILSLYGSSYTDKWTLIVLCASTIPISCSSVIGLSFASHSKMWTGLLFNLFWALSFVAFSWLFFEKNFGSLGAAISLFISYLIHMLIQLIYFKVKIR